MSPRSGGSLPIARHAGAEDIVAMQAGRPIARAKFAADAAALARLLPARRHVLNLCTDRYRFMLGFAAALRRGQVSLLPASIVPLVLRDLADDYPDLYALSDGAKPALECLAFPELPAAVDFADLPEIPQDQPALVLFTSGSTGKPKPVPKNWGPLARGAQAAAARLRDAAMEVAATEDAALAGATLIATVPHQHSYGLESIILLCLQLGCRLEAAAPLYPADITAAIERSPAPRILVTTPVHLRALLADSPRPPPVELLLCATAPLPQALARQAEAAFGGVLIEIYGCTEAGQIATRRSARETVWRCLDGAFLHEDARGVFAHGPAVQGRVLLHDRIELTGDACFLLGGRSDDLVDVAGKRASLAQLTHLLTGIPGVRDGVFLMGSSGRVPRLTALVVAPRLTRSALLQALRSRIDPAFIPRPLIFVDALPRNEVGKLPREALLGLLAQRGGA